MQERITLSKQWCKTVTTYLSVKADAEIVSGVVSCQSSCLRLLPLSSSTCTCTCILLSSVHITWSLFSKYFLAAFLGGLALSIVVPVWRLCHYFCLTLSKPVIHFLRICNTTGSWPLFPQLFVSHSFWPVYTNDPCWRWSLLLSVVLWWSMTHMRGVGLLLY